MFLYINIYSLDNVDIREEKNIDNENQNEYDPPKTHSNVSSSSGDLDYQEVNSAL